jgi:hypothetical protein
MRMLATLMLTVVLQSVATAPAAACTTPEYRQFDFWIGDWDVTDLKTGQHAGSSRIEQLYGSCALRENWSEAGFAGGSLNIYSRADGQWHQTWVDQNGALREFVGGFEHGQMILVAHSVSPTQPSRPILVRMTFTPNSDGSVRQYSDYSDDDGHAWKYRYDYLYRHPAAERKTRSRSPRPTTQPVRIFAAMSENGAHPT